MLLSGSTLTILVNSLDPSKLCHDDNDCNADDDNGGGDDGNNGDGGVDGGDNDGGDGGDGGGDEQDNDVWQLRPIAISPRADGFPSAAVNGLITHSFNFLFQNQPFQISWKIIYVIFPPEDEIAFGNHYQ